MTTHDILYNAIHINGMNLDYLLSKTGIDKLSFIDKWESDKFNHEEQKLIREIVRNWERKEDLR